MGVPVKKHTSGRRKRRSSHLALKAKTFSNCTKCSQPVLPHHACNFCGNYNGRTAIAIRPVKAERELAKKSSAK